MAELGQKHECAKCGAKYYDLGKADAECPKCGVDEDAPDDSSKDDAEK